VLEEKTGAGSSKSRCHCEFEPNEALRLRWLFVDNERETDSEREIDRDRALRSFALCTGVFSGRPVSEG
jgi:hypothetical protein